MTCCCGRLVRPGRFGFALCPSAPAMLRRVLPETAYRRRLGIPADVCVRCCTVLSVDVDHPELIHCDHHVAPDADQEDTEDAKRAGYPVLRI